MTGSAHVLIFTVTWPALSERDSLGGEPSHAGHTVGPNVLSKSDAESDA